MVRAMTALPLRRRPLDWLLLAFFALNLTFITYQVDIEQIIVRDPSHFTYPVWPPRAVIDLVQSYGHTYDPALIAREAWWRAMIWIDVLFYGPFYAFAVYAFWRGRNWIRMPSIVWAVSLVTEMIIIGFEEAAGAHASPKLSMVILANLAWLVSPLLTLWRMGRSVRPFSTE